MSALRLTFAFILAPLVPVAVYCAPSLLFDANINALLAVVWISGLVTYGHAILLGIPAAIVLVRLRRLTLPRVLGAAFLIGAIPYTVWTIYNEVTMPPGGSFTANFEVLRIDGHLTRKGWVSIIDGIVLCGVLGMATGLVWWWIARASANKPLQPIQERAAER
jgi:hypothetical protein